MAQGGGRLFREIRITQRLISPLQQFAVRRASPGGTAEAAVSYNRAALSQECAIVLRRTDFDSLGWLTSAVGQL
jgi:hypothetical protein